jgi:gluconate 2-dehydrogenase gamma chain
VDEDSHSPAKLSRRDVLAAGSAVMLVGASMSRADPIAGHLPWVPNAGNPPLAATPGPWLYFTAAEGRAVEALADRIIPADADTPGGKDAGCAVFVDRQLGGAYGRQEGLYVTGPFEAGAKNQGPQTSQSPAQQYRAWLAAFDRACAAQHGGKVFADLAATDQDAVLQALEKGDLKLEGVSGQAFLDQAIKDIQMGFFADPVYGGNRNMVAWKMIGFPGARYNYLDWVNRHNERFPLPPVSIGGRAEWTPKGG